MLENEDEADTGRGELIPPVFPTGRDPIEDVFGVKSNKGARSGATPYWMAISRPRSSGILYGRREQR